MRVTVIGGGLAGVESAYYLANRGIEVILYEMRPYVSTEIHKTGYLAELVCSNSLKSNVPYDASWLLKEEMRLLNSIVVETASVYSIPGGKSLVVDRELFSMGITERLLTNKNVYVIREECKDIPDDRPLIIATGPLTSEMFSNSLREKLGEDFLYFYDATSPVVTRESIDENECFWASRYNYGGADYLNCPVDEDTYNSFYDALVSAETVPLQDFEKDIFYEACLPVEEIAKRGRDALRFGPFKPKGLIDPRTGKMPYAVLQLRREDSEGRLLSLVGCQTRLRWKEQERVFRIIPALRNAEFVRFGVMHRNTFINSPTLLSPSLSLKLEPGIFFAGQITGVEGYLESAATGIVAGINAYRLLIEKELVVFPDETAIGSLIRYITTHSSEDFQPMGINYGIMPELKHPSRKERRRIIAEMAIDSLRRFLNEL
ncbi:MAG: methylenetetrahydrofolate--tRNA-(uracil(54)-C(5))-methyltransferase (FADH(2)-oxidizing) TrmFO [Dictyoglomi bacterium]|nr:methylenetetrahydrofolate--tRNA-(uracil(54)-C(5))-methyltransferase (FADH(2)-oxidizing) TrmFO [Dictyoglomota bacterium]